MTLGQRVAVMRDGELQQVAPPMEVYRRPANAFVGSFVGSPAMNFLACAGGADGEGARLRCGAVSLDLDGGEVLGGREGPLLLGIRPHDVEPVEPDAGDVRARVDVVEPLGSEVLLHLRVEGLEEAIRAARELEAAPEAEGGETEAAGRGEAARDAEAAEEREAAERTEAAEFRAVVPPETGAAVDDRLGLRFRRDRLHLFDGASGRRLN